MRNMDLYTFVFVGGILVLISISLWKYMVGVLALCGLYYLLHLYMGRKP